MTIKLAGKILRLDVVFAKSVPGSIQARLQGLARKELELDQQDLACQKTAATSINKHYFSSVPGT